ncbi:MAG: hypothetical protein HOP23_15560 [Methylococcaceae bacterium]|nr:hypothetical protein [Methylococcaceae bacterium]
MIAMTYSHDQSILYAIAGYFDSEKKHKKSAFALIHHETRQKFANEKMSIENDSVAGQTLN